MQFLRTIFWVLLAVALVIFAFGNWTTVTVVLWGGLRLDIKLPVLVIGAFLIGLIPSFLLYRTTRWRMGKKLATTERALNEARAPATPVVVEEPRPLTTTEEPPRSSAPPLAP